MQGAILRNQASTSTQTRVRTNPNTRTRTCTSTRTPIGTRTGTTTSTRTGTSSGTSTSTRTHDGGRSRAGYCSHTCTLSSTAGTSLFLFGALRLSRAPHLCRSACGEAAASAPWCRTFMYMLFIARVCSFANHIHIPVPACGPEVESRPAPFQHGAG